MNENTWPFLLICGGLLVFLLTVSFFSQRYSLNNIKSKTVGDGQHGTAHWATPKEIRGTYHVVPFRPRRWRKGIDLPQEQGVILGSMGGVKKKRSDRATRLPDKVLEMPHFMSSDIFWTERWVSLRSMSGCILPRRRTPASGTTPRSTAGNTLPIASSTGSHTAATKKAWKHSETPHLRPTPTWRNWRLTSDKGRKRRPCMK